MSELSTTSVGLDKPAKGHAVFPASAPDRRLRAILDGCPTGGPHAVPALPDCAARPRPPDARRPTPKRWAFVTTKRACRSIGKFEPVHPSSFTMPCGRLKVVTERTVARLTTVTFLVSGLLLFSMGGAIVAAPVTLPLLFVVARQRPTRRVRWTAGVLAALTTAEAGWAATYVLVGEAKPVIWLLPTLAGIGAIVAVVRRGGDRLAAV